MSSKESERHTVVKFISHQKLKLPVVKLEDSEKPDFIIHLSDGNISLEHTRLLNQKQKQIEVFRKKILKKAEQIFIKKYDTSFRVWINFSRSSPMDKKHKESYYVEMILKKIEEIYLNNKGRDFTVKTKMYKIENEYINSIHVTTEISPVWETHGAFLVEYADIDWVQERIYKKSNLITQYDKEYIEHWLIMEASLGNQSSGYRYEHIINKLNKGSFDRVFIFESIPDELFEIS